MHAAGRPQILTPKIFRDPRITAGFTTRVGGHSNPPFDTFNLGFSSGDDRETVARNRRLLAEELGIERDRIAIAHQVHGANAAFADSPGEYPGNDGLVTTQSGICLCIVAADCAAILLADADRRVIGACHAGWRGTVAGIVPNTVRLMSSSGADPATVRAYVSPCISERHFEVGHEVAERFHGRYVSAAAAPGKYFVDLKAAIRDQLAKEGIPENHIEVSGLCTFSRTDLFFSHRAENGRTGRMMGFIMQTS